MEKAPEVAALKYFVLIGVLRSKLLLKTKKEKNALT